MSDPMENVVTCDVCTLIDELRDTEGACVTINSDNADILGPCSVIFCEGDWTAWEIERFSGNSLVAALKKAVEEKRKAETPSDLDMALYRAGMLDT